MTRSGLTLAQVLEGVVVHRLVGDPRTPVRGLTGDSRQAGGGSVFVALKGERVDGHDFVEQAARQGAAAAVVCQPYAGPRPPALVEVEDTREAMAQMAANLHGHPSRSLSLVGITGTNGKTTLTYLLEAVLRAAGRSPGVIGTVDVRWAGRKVDNPHTTPQPPELQALLAGMVGDGVDFAVMEVSSHALELKRVFGCHFRVAVFTNLSRDHLDFHGDLEHYAAAKELLFGRELASSGADGRTAVINVDDPAAEGMVSRWPGQVVRYGLGPAALVRPEGSPRMDLQGIRARVRGHGGSTIDLRSRLIGRHNLENLVAAVAVAGALGIEPAHIERGLAACERVPGRLERVDCPGPAVFVDYAHTDHALVNVLGALAPLTRGRLVTVFGCGGDRDRGKRPLMGAAVAGGADLAVVTSDNPRSEQPRQIISQILPGLDDGGWSRVEPGVLATLRERAYCVVEDRRAAIELAVALAEPDDAVLIAGKGHETYQIIGTERRHFDDREEARRALDLRAARGEP